MSKIAEIYEQVGRLLANANSATGMSDTSLTDAVNSLIDGYGTGSEEVDVSGIVEYYREAVTDAINYTRNLGRSWVHNICVTDTHYDVRNCKNSAPMMQIMMGTGLYKNVIHCGDFIELATSMTDYNAFKAQYEGFNGRLLLALGNHDPKANATASPTFADIYTDFLSKRTDMGGNPQEFSYTADDSANRIRYIVFKYSAGADERKWVADAIATTPDDWMYVLIDHYGQMTEIASIAPYIGLGNAMTKAKGIFINGHRHYDLRGDIYGIPDITFMSDCLTQGGAIEQEGLRVAGTDSEHCITIMSANVDSGEVKFHRIGAWYDEAFRQYSAECPEKGDWVSGILNGQGAFEENSVYKILNEKIHFVDDNDCVYVVHNNISDVKTEVDFASFYADGLPSQWKKRIAYPNSQHPFDMFNGIVKIYPQSGNYDCYVCAKKPSYICRKDGLPSFPIDLTDGWQNGYPNADGSFNTTSGDYSYHNIVSVEAGKSYILKNAMYNPTGQARIAFFSGADRYDIISRISPSYADGEIEFTVPEGAIYAVVAVPQSEYINATTMYVSGEPMPEPTYTLEQIAQMGYVKPTGSIPITQNGTFDVSAFASALVNVQGESSDPVTPPSEGIALPQTVDVVTGVLSGGYLVGESSKIGNIRMAIYMCNQIPDASINCTWHGTILWKDTALDAYRGTGISASGAWASASIVNSKKSNGKIQFIQPSGLPFLPDEGAYTIVMFGDPK